MLSSFAIAFIVFFFFGVLFESRRNDIKKQNRQIQPPIVPMYYNNGPIAQQPYDITSFHIAGVTFNDGRQSRQTSLRMLKFKDAPMDGQCH